MISDAVPVRKRLSFCFFGLFEPKTNLAGIVMINRSDMAARNLEAVKNTTPLIHAITNFVTMGWVADVLSAVGASPIMADAVEEVEEVTALADALVLNLGTLSPGRLAGMLKAGHQASATGIPIVLDPVGAGAISARTKAALKILNQFQVSVIRANASEMLALSGQTIQGRGVDTIHPVESARAAARQVAAKFGLIAVVTGAKDLITTGDKVIYVANGHPLMGRVSGSGCAVGAVIGTFLAVDFDPLDATLSALAYFNLAGEMAAEKTALSGSFKIALIDALDTMAPAMLRQGARIIDGDDA